ncbi:hypothetical protein HPB49_012139 [Dermacentor silvarum]|uniref:Uncharacterized protein n=1 Tax=Dermacentor silvarum TaxID=543639 RepID=A0ACB8C3I9_DERSI|nr:hypothetical protein HPB49_012139 [Dermacentor silvarum]
MLSRGPKYSVEAPITKHELLATAHNIADKVHTEDRERCRQECVEAVRSGYEKKDGTRMMRRIAGYMKDSGHALMLADKEGSSVVMPQGLFGDKALAAVRKNFRISDEKPQGAKKKAVALLEDLKLNRIKREVKNNKVHALTVFFSAKSLKVDCPFRAIVTERGTGQATVSRYLQRQLSGLNPEDPYKIASSDRLSQGATYASVVYEYSRTHPQKLVYVVLSRCTHLGGLYLTNALGDHSFYHREDKPERAMTDEFRRLENHRLQTVTGRYLDALRREEQRERRRHAFTLALLNVRSLRAHALDVARDPVVVPRLTETWNNNKQEGGQEARGEGAVGEQGFAPVVRARAVDARSRAGGVDVHYRSVRWRGGMVRHSWSYADTRGEYAGFTAVCDEAYRSLAPARLVDASGFRCLGPACCGGVAGVAGGAPCDELELACGVPAGWERLPLAVFFSCFLVATLVAGRWSLFRKSAAI